MTQPAHPATPPGPLSRLAGLLAAPLLMAVVVQNVANFAFHAAVGRMLPAGEYGAMGSVLAVMVLLSVPLTALQAAASAQVSGSGWDDTAVRQTLARCTLGALAVGLAVALAAPAIRDFFRLESTLDAVVLAPFAAVSVVLAVARGLLLGDGRVPAVAGTYLLGTAARLGLGLALAVPLGVTGALLGTLAGEVVALAVGLWPVLRRHARAAGATALGLRPVALTAVAVTGLFLFSTVDLLLARHYLPDDATGAYVAAATIAKTVLALPAAAMSVYYPRLVAGWQASRPWASLRAALVVVAGLAVVGGLAVAAVPGLLLGLLYGPDGYSDAAGLVRLLALVAGLTGIVSVLTYAGLARRSASIVVPWAAAILEVALIAARHDSVGQVATGSVAALVPALVVLSAWEVRAWRRRSTAGRGRTVESGTGTGSTTVPGTAPQAERIRTEPVTAM